MGVGTAGSWETCQCEAGLTTLSNSLALVMVHLGVLTHAVTAASDGDEVGVRFHAIDVLCHLGSLIETLAFMQQNMLVLRLLECVSSGMLAVYSMVHTKNGTDCHLMWAVVHFMVNFYHVAKYLRAYCSIKLTEMEASLLSEDGLFSCYNRVEFAELKRRYTWRTYRKGCDIMTEGGPVQEIFLVVSGGVQVVKGGEVIDTLHTDRYGPQFFGEMAFFTTQQASATIRVLSEEVTAIVWSMEEVRALSSSHGHSLVEMTYRQLPALFAAQLAYRAAQASGAVSRYKQSHLGSLSSLERFEMGGSGRNSPSFGRRLYQIFVSRSRVFSTASPRNRLETNGSMSSLDCNTSLQSSSPSPTASGRIPSAVSQLTQGPSLLTLGRPISNTSPPGHDLVSHHSLSHHSSGLEGGSSLGYGPTTPLSSPFRAGPEAQAKASDADPHGPLAELALGRVRSPDALEHDTSRTLESINEGRTGSHQALMLHQADAEGRAPAKKADCPSRPGP